LRFGDEVLAFGGRDITTVNALKNVLGIFPKGWRVPLSYRHGEERFDVLVRLRGVHTQVELAEMLEAEPQPEPRRPGEPRPGKPGPDTPPKDPEQPPTPLPFHRAKPEPMPEVVKKHYVEKPGYVNYYFNELHRDRVWKALVARGDYAALKDQWTITGTTAMGDEIRFLVSDHSASIKMAAGEQAIELEGELAARPEPPGSGGLLVALALWRRMLVLGPEDFGDVTYLGTAPVDGREGLADVLVGLHRDVECRFYFDPADGEMVAMEMFPEEDTDPCELYFSDYRETDGRMLPGRIVVRHGDGVYQAIDCKQFGFAEAGEE
jgi:hypothetical protein